MVTDEIIGLFVKNNQEKQALKNGVKLNWAILNGLRTDNFLSGKAKSDSDEFSGEYTDAGVDLSDTISRAAQ